MRRRLARSIPPLLAAVLLAGPATADEPPRVVASIAPVHSLVAAVVGDLAQPHLLVPPGRSPHTYSLAPSDARALTEADVVVMAGGATDRFLERPLASLAGDAARVALLGLPDARRLPARGGGAWAHGADGAGDGHEHEQAHEHGETDPHAWLDPRNGAALARAVARELARLDPANAARYRANAAAVTRRLETLDGALAEQLAAVADRPYLVFHDAYQYFERRYDLAAAGSIVVDPGRPPGARRVSELRERVAAEDVRCLFVEPQFEPRIARSIAEGTGARIATLDPLGTGLEPGPDLYPALLTRLADALTDCLGGDGSA